MTIPSNASSVLGEAWKREPMVSRASVSVLSVPPAPGTPSFLAFSEITSTTLNVSWGEPAAANGILQGYRVVYEPLAPVQGKPPGARRPPPPVCAARLREEPAGQTERGQKPVPRSAQRSLLGPGLAPVTWDTAVLGAQGCNPSQAHLDPHAGAMMAAWPTRGLAARVPLCCCLHSCLDPARIHEAPPVCQVLFQVLESVDPGKLILACLSAGRGA